MISKSRSNITAVKVTKTMARKILSTVPEEKIFWSHDGQMFRNLKELEQGLSNMDDETYTYHANGYKNDFTNWVKDVIGDQELAKDLATAMSHWDASKKVNIRIGYLSTIK